MTLLSEMQAAAVEVLTALGTTATLQSVVGVYSYNNGGTVTETVTSSTITASDLVDEQSRYGTLATDRRVAGTFYVVSATEPKLGDRIVYQSRNFAVLAVWTYSAQGGTVAYRLDVAEIGSA